MQQKSSLKKTFLILLFLPVVILAVKTVVDLRKGAAGIPANIIVNTKSTQGPVPSNLWQNLAQGGEEAKDMIQPVISQVKALKPRLIRVDHLYDYYNVYIGPGNYDFSRLDQVIDSILATGAKPMLSISYTPANMAKDNKVANQPLDWNEWSNLVFTTAKRYSVDKKISGIYYEVWNEPDLFGGWHYGRDPSYSTLYSYTATAIQKGASPIPHKIGGPAITAYYSNWIKSLFKLCSKNHIPLDFISWHKYSKNTQDYLNDFENLNKILSDYPQYFNIERLITEVGPNSEPDIWYDNKMSGIHLISLATQLSGKIHKIFPFEIIDGPTKRHDHSLGWGMISHSTNGAKEKPRYYAIQFLNKLQGQRLSSSGDGSWVTSLSAKNGQTSQVLLVNYDSRNQHLESVPVTFQNLIPTKYQLKKTPYLGASTTKIINVTQSVHTENIYMEPNTAILLELTPLSF